MAYNIFAILSDIFFKIIFTPLWNQKFYDFQKKLKFHIVLCSNTLKLSYIFTCNNQEQHDNMLTTGVTSKYANFQRDKTQ
jgi:hypothetical protein